MSAASAVLGLCKLLLTAVAMGSLGVFLLAAVVWGRTPPTDGEDTFAGPRPDSAPPRTSPTARKVPDPAAVIEFGPGGELKRSRVGYRSDMRAFTSSERKFDEARGFGADLVASSRDPGAVWQIAGRFDLLIGTVLVGFDRHNSAPQTEHYLMNRINKAFARLESGQPLHCVAPDATFGPA
jgi:hypothetical protein